MSKENTFIISVGGSLIVPKEGIDWKFLKKFRSMILGQIKAGKKFFLVTGGGATCRLYQQAANKVIKISSEDLDWLGIHSSRLNAHLLRTVLFDIAHPEVIKNPTIEMQIKKKVVIAGGWKPGWSTDYVAALIAEKYGVKKVINLSNIDYAYDKDPKKYPDAKVLASIDWKSFRKIVGNKWIPGMNAPFDPIASKKAQTLGLEVAIMNGQNFLNLARYLNGEKFRGTNIA